MPAMPSPLPLAQHPSCCWRVSKSHSHQTTSPRFQESRNTIDDLHKSARWDDASGCTLQMSRNAPECPGIPGVSTAKTQKTSKKLQKKSAETIHIPFTYHSHTINIPFTYHSHAIHTRPKSSFVKWPAYLLKSRWAKLNQSAPKAMASMRKVRFITSFQHFWRYRPLCMYVYIYMCVCNIYIYMCVCNIYIIYYNIYIYTHLIISYHIYSHCPPPWA